MSLITVGEAPTLYQHYTAGGVNTGLSAKSPQFTLNDKNITLYSGAMHYFRVPRQYWRDRLRKMRAAGLNTVETYVPWNLHEPEPGTYDFGNGGTDMQDFLALEEFLKTAQEEDLLAIVRPGPYICAEWEFGGLPSWLLREKDITVRSSDKKFMKHVTRYFNVLIPILAMLQFTKGGPIVAVQIEKDYASTRVNNNPVDKVYLNQLENLLIKNGIVELLVTTDTMWNGDAGAFPGALQTAIFQNNPEWELQQLQRLQPNKPLMVMEYWTGWLDHWTENHNTRSADEYADVLRRILEFPASVNLYMFHGGTSWGFLNGANDNTMDNEGFQPDTTSYDYDAPLTEAGDYTEKYTRTKELIRTHNTVITRLPDPPAETPRVAYPSVPVTEQLTLAEIEDQVSNKVVNRELLPMELLPINNNAGQSYGYIVYKKTNVNIPANSVLKIGGRVCDTVMVLVNGVLKSKSLSSSADLDGFGYWRQYDSELNLGPEETQNATLELVVENWGRNNFGWLSQFKQFKGLWQGAVSINAENLYDWEMYPLEFKKKWTNGLVNWHAVQRVSSPSLYRAKFTVSDLQDTYLDMREWTKGFVIINGFVLGRHAMVGPQMTLYIPAPLLKRGENDIIVFEHFNPAKEIKFVTDPIFKGN
ncbi:beta galactosidase [Carabus blaptoides fortunei]